MALTKIGASLGGGADTIFVTQAGHGLTLGYPVKANNNGTYAHATANTAANAEAIGIIIETTTDTMLIALSGRVTVDGCVPNLSAGTVLFLQVSAGLLAAAEPDGNNEVSKPMAVITYANSEMILLSHRGEVISTAGVVSAPTDANYLVGTANSNLSAEIVVGTAPGGELGNTWASPTVDGTHSGSAHHADAHTVASHSDTTATGTELETLTDGSTTALHVHAGGTAPVFNRVVRTAGTVSTTSTSLVDATGATVTFTTGAFPVAYGAKLDCRNSIQYAEVVFNVDIDGTLEFGSSGLRVEDMKGDGISNGCFVGQSAALSAASHTIKQRWAVSAGTGSIFASSANNFVFWAHEIR